MGTTYQEAKQGRPLINAFQNDGEVKMPRTSVTMSSLSFSSLSFVVDNLGNQLVEQTPDRTPLHLKLFYCVIKETEGDLVIIDCILFTMDILV